MPAIMHGITMLTSMNSRVLFIVMSFGYSFATLCLSVSDSCAGWFRHIANVALFSVFQNVMCLFLCMPIVFLNRSLRSCNQRLHFYNRRFRLQNMPIENNVCPIVFRTLCYRILY